MRFSPRGSAWPPVRGRSSNSGRAGAGVLSDAANAELTAAPGPPVGTTGATGAAEVGGCGSSVAGGVGGEGATATGAGDGVRVRVRVQVRDGAARPSAAPRPPDRAGRRARRAGWPPPWPRRPSGSGPGRGRPPSRRARGPGSGCRGRRSRRGRRRGRRRAGRRCRRRRRAPDAPRRRRAAVCGHRTDRARLFIGVPAPTVEPESVSLFIPGVPHAHVTRRCHP